MELRSVLGEINEKSVKLDSGVRRTFRKDDAHRVGFNNYMNYSSDYREIHLFKIYKVNPRIGSHYYIAITEQTTLSSGTQRTFYYASESLDVLKNELKTIEDSLNDIKSTTNMYLYNSTFYSYRNSIISTINNTYGTNSLKSTSIRLNSIDSIINVINMNIINEEDKLIERDIITSAVYISDGRINFDIYTEKAKYQYVSCKIIKNIGEIDSIIDEFSYEDITIYEEVFDSVRSESISLEAMGSIYNESERFYVKINKTYHFEESTITLLYKDGIMYSGVDLPSNLNVEEHGQLLLRKSEMTYEYMSNILKGILGLSEIPSFVVNPEEAILIAKRLSYSIWNYPTKKKER